MLKSLLIGLDGTESDAPAQALGLRWAKQLDALVVGLAVVDEPGIQVSETTLFSEGYHRPVGSLVLPELRRRAGEVLRRFSRACDEARVACRTLEAEGTPYAKILQEAQRCDLILLGQETHFEYGWQDAADETLARVLRDAPRPVVAVPRGEPTGDAIVVAYDGSLQASRTLFAFESSGLGRSREVHVVTVAGELDEASHIADLAVEYLGRHEVRAVPHPVDSSSPPAEVILAKADRLKAGLLVMGSYGKPVLREFFLGSATRTILRDSRVPVFCFH